MAERHKIIPASYLILIRGDKILLLKRSNTGFEDGNYSFVAGHVEADETFTETMIREAKEEAGIDLRAEDMKMVHMMHRRSSQNDEERVDAFFMAEKWGGEIKNMEPEKCSDLGWFDLDNLPDNIIPYIKKVVKEVINKNNYSEYGWGRKE